LEYPENFKGYFDLFPVLVSISAMIDVSEAARFDGPIFHEDNAVNGQVLRKYLQEVGQDMKKSMGALFEPVRCSRAECPGGRFLEWVGGR
jgi:hypothetical protein